MKKEYVIEQSETEFQDVNEKVWTPIQIPGNISDELTIRVSFLQTIKDGLGAVKELFNTLKNQEIWN